MKRIITFMIGIFFLINILNLNVIMAQENCTEGICIVNYTEQEDEEIKCDNFKWVENYIMKELENTTSQGKIDLVNILKNTNYNLQDDLNKCEDRAQRYFYGLIFSFIIVFVSVVFLIRSYIK